MASAYLLIARVAEDRYVFDVPSWLRQAVLALADELDDELDGDHPVFHRLFPTAYPDDPEKDAGYQILARGELIETRHSAIDTVRASADAEELDGESLDAWMRVVNDLRLVLGTHMDLSENDRWTPRPDDEGYYATYEAFSLLLQSIVEAQMHLDDEDLPAPEDEDDE